MADEGEWRRSAAALGLTVFEPVRGFAHSDGFEKVLRLRAPPRIGDRRSTFCWMTGRSHVPPMQCDVDVIVLQDSHSRGDEGEVYVETHVLARIDPPLLLGLNLELHHQLRLFGAPTLQTGDPQFDGAFRLRATLVDPALRLFHRTTAPPNDLVDHLLAIPRLGTVTIYDSCVNVQTTENIAPLALAPCIASATALAALLAHRRGALPRAADEQERLAVWKAFAESAGFHFDDQRFLITGTIDNGARLRLAVESGGQNFFTTLTIEPPRPLGLGLQLTQQGAMQFLADLFCVQDIRIGDEAFDKAFVIKGTNEQAVRAFFWASPIARQALIGLLRWDASLEFRDNGVIAHWPRVADGPTLARATQAARAVATLFAYH